MATDKDLSALSEQLEAILRKQDVFIEEVKQVQQTLSQLREVQFASHSAGNQQEVSAFVTSSTALREEAEAAERTGEQEAATVAPPVEEVKPVEVQPIEKEPVQTAVPPVKKRVVFAYTKDARSGFPVSKGERPEVSFTPQKKTDWERFIGENLFNKIGIGILIIGVFIGVKYSIDHNLISAVMRIVLGYLMGVGLFVTGALLYGKYKSFSAILVSGAMTIFYFVTYIAYTVFGFFPQSVAFVLMFIFTVFTVAASLRYNQVAIALIGLVGSYAVPFLLSDNSGRVGVLFAYTAIINIGVLVLSFYKRWRVLYYSAFVFTWLLLLSMYSLGNTILHFSEFFLFDIATFLTFYVAFIVQQKATETLEISDGMLFLANSLFFYGIGVALVNEVTIGRTFLSVFTLANALLHFGVAYYFHQRRSAQALKYLVVVLSLSFATLVVPIQFEGSWITLLWSVEAGLLFVLGRRKDLLVYERISYVVLLLATISLLMDWGENLLEGASLSPTGNMGYSELPFANLLFFNSLIYGVITGFITYVMYKYPREDSYQRGLVVLLNVVCVGSVFFTFLRELSRWSDYAYLFLYEDVIFVIYTLLFWMLYIWINRKFIGERTLAVVQGVIALLLLFNFLTVGLYKISEMRESYLALGDASQGWLLGLRYVALVVFAGFCYTVYGLKRQFGLWTEQAPLVTLGLHTIVLWVASSELLHWSDLYQSHQSYKLGLSILWGAYAVLLVVLGLFGKKRYLRYAGIGLVGVVLLKLFFYDTTHLDTLAKTVVFVALGILLLIASFLYNKYTNSQEEE